ncbi:3'-phosphoadenosine 5'-phosphosulfate sulfotransferase [Yamadazyma tenuis]|uniref:FAD synthase n=1 Tax=Candida tenuis (strain ATCC 10573 / BCRC 21748 / CBS 615 / JCM 9827 / NBRC 10315 / NRRL Y-1498 / VKM Y-70) TaxID=590646 RepID=G3B986_CANTC|nr:adenine nucleotide alpha hydrolases-like protein [Yamadazyma tenuis ATCC 10573]XP_006688849.1 uncharacterized protein CANTEDRAFT_115285 [Yamadazyma tenuis ATCC 10573]EGV62678.1 adenine nucleotide alpha hydrolases-like protein [Yamadazyma tenuis ATCC 10573]EGV62679.1 hypothetical protein CANTEDRAFT_115285 [Yamadazyma tenuis ATCC 10573]WEJ93064.1 3'-phosphoadenosine 5'-phosphosulfate sulfotransferase [Yamadazyma tenuis]
MSNTFYDRCKEAHELVSGYLTDSLPWGNVPPSRANYVFNPQIRAENKAKITRSAQVLRACLTKYNLNQLAISYNGGKDCLVMLLIFLYAIYERSLQVEQLDPTTLPANDQFFTKKYLQTHRMDSIYINSEDPFEEVSQFISTSTKHYNLNPISIKSSLKDGFEQYLNGHPDIKAIIVGIRHSDPYGSSLSYEQETDHQWPKFIRVHPILHWNYVDIWDFIIGCNLDYCVLYDRGYTSLGGVKTTVPNPVLVHGGESAPAYAMTEDADDRERLGRNKAPQ